jgi:hypothetical protein
VVTGIIVRVFVALLESAEGLHPRMKKVNANDQKEAWIKTVPILEEKRWSGATLIA